ncbi:MAG: NAD(P)-dependent oxidoreductase [Desulfitobacteriaceae bacterium]
MPYEPSAVSVLKVVVFGTGVIGQELARNLQHFGADVSGVSLSGEPKTPFNQVVVPNQCERVLMGAHWVINTLPFTPQTDRLFNSKVFQHLDKACFINVGRGASVDEESLLEALDQRKLRLAVLDVFREEPLPAMSPFWNRPDIVVTPHISAITSLDDAVTCFLRTQEDVEAGIRPENTVDTDRGY